MQCYYRTDDHSHGSCNPHSHSLSPLEIIMKCRLRLWTTLSLMLVSAAAFAEEKAQNTLTDAEKTAGWKLLFDGKTTAGWRNFKKDSISQGWKVEDGNLVRSGKDAGD